jgi:SOS regulatory protein LexA
MPREINISEKVAALRTFHARERRLPGYNEMLELFGYSSKNAVHGLLRKLEQQGYVARKGHKVAATAKLTGALRLLGSVAAGFPSPAEEELLDTLSLDEFLVEKPEATFMLKVTGDSMSEAGIYPDDLVLVERGVEPKTNDIVVAQVDGEWTMKYFVKDDGGVRLEPANRKYRPIRPQRSMEIGGVVRTVIRKLA